MLDNTDLSTLIGQIYDCVPDRARWRELLENLCRTTESEVGTLAVIAPRERNIRFGGVHGARAITEPLTKTYARHMPFFDTLPRMQVGYPYLMSDMYAMIGDEGREILEDTVMFREWNRPHGLTDSYCIALFKKPEEVVCLNLVLSEERRPVTPMDRQLVSMLVPHIRRAAKLGTQLDMMARQNRSMRRLADQMNSGIIVVSRDLQILQANAIAEEMLAEAEIIRSVRGKLVIPNPLAAARIEQDVSLSSVNEEQLGKTSLAIPLGGTSNPSVANVIPLARRDLDRRFASTAAAAIVIADPKREAALAGEAFGDLYGLTMAERRVALLTAEGLGRATIAALTGVKESTVKSHLESIFSKTGASGQTALTILMRSLSPPIRS